MGNVHLLLKTNTYVLVRQMRIEIIGSLKNIDEHKGDHCKLCGGNESRLHDFEKTEKE